MLNTTYGACPGADLWRQKFRTPASTSAGGGDSISAQAVPLLQLLGQRRVEGVGIRLAGSLNTSDFISGAQWEA